jgi:hypothetical protein
MIPHRLLSLAWCLLAVAGAPTLAACDRRPVPSRQPPAPISGERSGVADPPEPGICDTVAQVLAAPAPRRLRLVRDTLVPDPGIGTPWPRPGCLLQVTDTSGPGSGLTEQLDQWLRHQGWLSATPYSADGTDGTVFGFVRNGQLCIVQGRWDGGDGTDSAYVPRPEYELTVGCVSGVTTDTAR